MSTTAEDVKQLPLSVKLAESADELEQVFRLRYEVFVEEKVNPNLMNEAKMERDEFDDYCDHLIVTNLNSGKVIATYRLLPGPRALQKGGFYSETEFDLSDFSIYKWNSLELGRSCVAPEFRDGKAIQLLWEGIADYVTEKGYRHLIGCASLHVSNVQEISEIYSMLVYNKMATDRFGIRPLETHRVQDLRLLPKHYEEKDMYRRLPPLMKGYYWLGAQIGGEPALDPVFQTTDFFIVLDTENITGKYKRRFMRKQA